MLDAVKEDVALGFCNIEQADPQCRRGFPAAPVAGRAATDRSPVGSKMVVKV